MTDLAFDAKDPETWPDDSYAGHERALAYILDDDTMEYYSMMTETYDENYTAWALFNLLMMHKAAYLSMIDPGGADPADAIELRLQVQADANENSGDYFRIALDTRIAHWRRLKDLASSFEIKRLH